MGYCDPILAGRDDSSIIITCHWGASTLFEEDEAKGSAKQSTACCGWTLWQHIGECAIEFLTNVMVWQFHCHHHCISLRNINIALGRINEVPFQLPTWLGMGFVTVGYCHLFLAGCDDSSIVIGCHWGTWTLLKEDEAIGYVKKSTVCYSWTLWQHIRGCVIQSLTNVMVWQLHHHHHCISLRRIKITYGRWD